jgi:nucleotidyltransferase/DNA polymerase involved in DNA repair
MAQFGCLWIADFPVWAATRADPSLQFQPVVVHRGGRIVALSSGAWQHGVCRGWSVARAQSLLPHVTALALDSAAIKFAWEQVLAALYQLTPRIESVSAIGAASALAVFEMPRRLETQQKLARLITEWQASCGMASRRSVAELAALTTAGGAVKVIGFGNEDAFLDRVPMSVLIEVGLSAATVQRLEWFGWRHVGALRALSRHQLLEQFEDGGRLLRFVHLSQRAAETRPVSNYIPPPAIEERMAFESAATQPAEWEAALDELLERATQRLCGQSTLSLSVAIETEQGRKVASRLLREPVNTARPLQVPARAMLRALLPAEKVAVQAIEIRLGQLSDRGEQGTLFEAEANGQPRPALRRVLTHLEARYSGAMRCLRLRDAYAPLPEERYHSLPALELLPSLTEHPRSRLHRG